MKKYILPILIFLALIVGITYYLLQPISNPSSPTQNNLPTTTVDQSTTATEQTDPTGDSDRCNTSDECIIISESNDLTSTTDVNIQCTTKSYLSNCKNCQDKSEIITQTKQEATCTCVKNFCQFERTSNP